MAAFGKAVLGFLRGKGGHPSTSLPMTEPGESDRSPDEVRLRRARACWEQSLADLKEARALLRQGRQLQSAYLSLQAALNAMASVCTLHGEFQYPAHSPTQMSSICASLDAHFNALAAPCAALESVQEQNPFAEEVSSPESRKEAREAYRHGKNVLGVVRGYLRTHRQKYFKP